MGRYKSVSRRPWRWDEVSTRAMQSSPDGFYAHSEVCIIAEEQ
ncbi:hypothetical protein VULLAG_LOCUS10250 [Vulpes lagopus]